MGDTDVTSEAQKSTNDISEATRKEIEKAVKEQLKGDAFKQVVRECWKKEDEVSIRILHKSTLNFLQIMTWVIVIFFLVVFIVSVWRYHTAKCAESSERATCQGVSTNSLVSCLPTSVTTNYLSWVGQGNAQHQFLANNPYNSLVVNNPTSDPWGDLFSKTYDMLRSEQSEWFSILGIIIAFFGVVVTVGSQLAQSKVFETELSRVKDEMAKNRERMEQDRNRFDKMKTEMTEEMTRTFNKYQDELRATAGTLGDEIQKLKSSKAYNDDVKSVEKHSSVMKNDVELENGPIVVSQVVQSKGIQDSGFTNDAISQKNSVGETTDPVQTVQSTDKDGRVSAKNDLNTSKADVEDFFAAFKE